ncbi:MAG: hypothetical protein EA370_17745 [Wenzhouxiangella sp.]|nr:MAG: hypothetical protein EA370_17745 [Wenzhouxiangella sp.]
MKLLNLLLAPGLVLAVSLVANAEAGDTPLVEAADAFVRAIAAGELEEAIASMTAANQAVVSESGLAMLRNNTGMAQLLDLDWHQSLVDKPFAEVHGQIRRRDGAVMRTVVYLEQVDGDWQVNGIDVSDPQP